MFRRKVDLQTLRAVCGIPSRTAVSMADELAEILQNFDLSSAELQLASLEKEELSGGN